MEEVKNITIPLNRYNELIQEEQKSKQYKAYCLENTHNNQLMKALTTIESKNLYKLITENQNKEEKKMSKLSLYNITNKFVEIMDKAEEGEITEEEYNKLGEELALELKNKSTSIVGYILNENAIIDATDIQIKRLQDMKKAKQNNVDNFKKYVKENMEKLGLSKVETEIGTISIAKSPMSVEIIDEDKIPSEYKKVVQEIKIDKTKIKEYFKETGEVIEGVKINSENTYLKIK